MGTNTNLNVTVRKSLAGVELIFRCVIENSANVWCPRQRDGQQWDGQ